MSSKDTIEIRDFSARPPNVLPDAGKVLFHIPDLTVKAHEKILLLGPSGCGKTTFLNCLARQNSFLGSLQAPDDVSYIYQDLNLVSYFNAKENIELEAPFAKAETFLEKLHLTDLSLKRQVRLMSFGERQRIAIARCLARNAELTLADEPTSHLDHSNAQIAMKLLVENSKTLVVVSHDESFKPIFNRVIPFQEWSKC